MKKLIAFVVALCLTGCLNTDTNFGECKGLFNQSEKSDKLVYEIDTNNIILTALFSESIIMPILILGLWIQCPVRAK